MKRTILTLVIALPALSGIGQKPMQHAMKENFASSSFSRLAAHASSDQIKSVADSANRWKATKSEKDFVMFTDSVHYTASLTLAKSVVSISTSRGPGASIKYQTIGERARSEPPITAKGLTQLTESMLIGMYYIWSERGGKPTSDKDARFSLVNPAEKVVLAEQ
jgi:hypothetical protein